MICRTCADAAARRAPRDQHCTDPTCPCGHRVDRYRPLDTPGWSTTLHDAGGRAARRLTAQLLGQQPGTAFEPVDGLIAAHLRAQDEALAADTWRQMVHGPATCAATLTSPFGAGALHCAQAAGHYDETTEPIFGTDGWATDPGGWHWAGPRTAVWADTADGATPHTDTTKD